MKPFVFITRKLPLEFIQEIKRAADVEMWEEEEVPCPRELLLKKAAKADGLLTMLSDKVDQELLHSAPQLKVIANLAVGFDNIDIDHCTEKGITVCNTPDVLTDTTADLTFALMMAAARRIVESAQYVKEGKWKSWGPYLLAGTDLHHKTVGIVGMGKIGRTFAKRTTGFDMKILYHNRSRNREAEEELGAEYCEFHDLLKRSDFVVCLAPLTNETKELFNREAFQQMKREAVFVNASRGAVVVEEALLLALEEGWIAGAGLDVFEREPIGGDHPLLRLPNVVALPHIGSASRETRTEMIQLCSRNLSAVLSGKKPETPVQ
ncbi:D-glycerate dehydrogenase [Bacillus lacus]|uniref:D-glycerate dehydrogenase n=1 Tax=Metabacillus lacus TaxID=1983721 RepID=A0A7X2LZQ7_9BACI|nr:D-glycerate dehydrogenase [Metabacillus lacus]MRX73223.1 D-glycerate dehydrogenase [Metabacillus lacus]